MNNIYEEILDIKGLTVEYVEVSSNRIDIHCKLDASGVCPLCDTCHKKVNQRYRRKIRDLDMSGKKVYLHLEVLQYECPNCGRTHSQTFDFVESGKSYTKRQAKWIYEMSAKQSHSEVGSLTDVHSKTVERIFYQEVENRFSDLDLTGITRIGIDEFSFKKGHKDFIVILIDLDTHEPIDLLPYRDKKRLIAYFQNLGDDFCQKIAWYSSDMWGPFLDLAAEVFPNAKKVVDRFHWTKHLNDALDSMRKELRREDKNNKAYKHLKWKLIKRPEHLSETEKKDLQVAFSVSAELEEIYEMRNTLISIFDIDFSFEQAQTQVQLWLEQAEKIGNEYLNKFVALCKRHQTGILNYFYERISNGVVEGKNNLLRTIKRITFNMTNFEHFKARFQAWST